MLFVLRLKCLVKRREALRGRNLPRDSQVGGAPRVHPASGALVAPGAVFWHPLDTFVMPPKIRSQTRAWAYALLHRPSIPVMVLSLAVAASAFLSGAARAVRRGGWIHLFAVAGRGGRNAAACAPG